MAQRIDIVLVDDVDGTPASETVQFALDGVKYEIDLSTGNAEKFREEMASWVSLARRTGGRKSQGRRRSAGAPADDIRAWARENGHDVHERGRVPANVRAAYEAANRK